MSIHHKISMTVLLSCILGSTLYLRHICLSKQEIKKHSVSTASTDKASIQADTTLKVEKTPTLPSVAHPSLLMEEDKQETHQGASSYKSSKKVRAYIPRLAPAEEVVKNLLDQKTPVKIIARQTGLSKDTIRKIKRKQKQDALKDKRERKRMGKKG